jgi:hypothetical protein
MKDASEIRLFIALFSKLYELHGKKVPSIGAIQMYINCLTEYEFSHIEMAIYHYQKSSKCQFLPQPGDLIEIMKKHNSTGCKRRLTLKEEGLRIAPNPITGELYA